MSRSHLGCASALSLITLSLAGTAQAAPVTHSFSQSIYVGGSLTALPGNLGSAVEIGFTRPNLAPTLPVALTNYSTTLRSDLTLPPEQQFQSGAFNFCAANGIDCVSGEIASIDPLPGLLGPFARIAATTTVTGGSGVYAGASGSWNNETYAIEDGFGGYSLFTLASGTISANGNTHNVDWSGFVDGTRDFSNAPIVINAEQSFLIAPMPSTGLPVAMRDYRANIQFDFNLPGPSVATGGDFTWCAVNGVDCLTGSIINLAQAPGHGPWARSTSTSVVTGGTGIYAGASGEWSNDAYVVGNGPGQYGLFNIATGRVTLAQVPLPATPWLLAGGTVLLGLRRHRFKRNR